MCELRRSGPRALLWELAMRNGLPPGCFSLKSGRITYATVGELRRDVAAGVSVPGAPVEGDDTDDDVESESSDHEVAPSGDLRGGVPRAIPSLDPLGNWSSNSRTQTTTYSQARFLGSGAGGYLVDGRLGREGIDTLLLPTLSLVPTSESTAGGSGAVGGGSGQASTTEQVTVAPAPTVTGSVEQVSTKGKNSALAPCCDQGPTLPLAVCVGDTGHDLVTVVGQYAGSPGDDNFNAAVECGLASYQPYHGDVSRGGPPKRLGRDNVLVFHCGVHEDGEHCVPCDLARKSGCSRDDTGEMRLVLAAECVGGEDNRGITSETINGVPFSQGGFLHHKSCVCAGMPFCARVRADMCSVPTLCMAVAAKASICALSYRFRSQFVPACFQDLRLPHSPPLIHMDDAWTLEDLHRREVASAENTAAVVRTRAEWAASRNPWLLARAAAFKARATAFLKTRKATIEMERVHQLNAESDEVRFTSMLVHQQRMANVVGQSAVSIAAMAVASSAARVAGYVKPVAIRAAVDDDQLLEQMNAEAIRVDEYMKGLLATRERVKRLEAAIIELNASLEGSEPTPPVTTSSLSMTEVSYRGRIGVSSAQGVTTTASSVSSGSGMFSDVTGMFVPQGPTSPTGVEAGFSTTTADNSEGSSEASIAVTYCAIIPVGQLTESRRRRLSGPPISFADEQAANAHGGQQKRGSVDTGVGSNKRGRGGSDKSTEDHKKDEDDKGV
jgi:hypothetical protein